MEHKGKLFLFLFAVGEAGHTLQEEQEAKCRVKAALYFMVFSLLFPCNWKKMAMSFTPLLRMSHVSAMNSLTAPCSTEIDMTLSKFAEGLREMYLSRSLPPNPYRCNSFTPRVLLACSEPGFMASDIVYVLFNPVDSLATSSQYFSCLFCFLCLFHVSCGCVCFYVYHWFIIYLFIVDFIVFIILC